MFIYLAHRLLYGSSDLTRPDTDVFGRSEPLLDRDLFGLAPRRDCRVSLPADCSALLVSVALAVLVFILDNDPENLKKDPRDYPHLSMDGR